MIDSQIVDFIEPVAEQKWSWVNLTLGIPSLLNLPLAVDESVFIQLSRHIYTHVQLDYDFYLALDKAYPINKLTSYKGAYLFKFFLGNTFLRKRDIKSKFINYLFYMSFKSNFAKSILYKLKGAYLEQLEHRIRKGNPDRS